MEHADASYRVLRVATCSHLGAEFKLIYQGYMIVIAQDLENGMYYTVACFLQLLAEKLVYRSG